MWVLYKTKLGKWFFNRYFGIPKDADIVSLQNGAIRYTRDYESFVCRGWQMPIWKFSIFEQLRNIALFPFAFLTKGFAFLLLTDTTSTNNKDNAISEYTSTTNYGTSAGVGYVASQTGGDDWRFLIHFTLASGSGTISAVTLNLYRHAGWGTNTALNLEVHELTRTDWVETEATWQIYKTGSSWTSAGGDYSATIVDAIAHNTTNGVWRVWNLGTGATNPIAGLTWGSNVHLIIRFSNTGASPTQVENMRNKDDASNKPYIEITYTAAPEADSLAPARHYWW